LPKQTFVGSDVLQLGVHDAISHFNIGCEASIQVPKNIGINPGKYCEAECSLYDNIRVKKADYKEQDNVKLNCGEKYYVRGRRERGTRIKKRKEKLLDCSF
jgi:hypothetical protein